MIRKRMGTIDSYFYMDPNQGCPFDAVLVFCNFTAGGSTCINPQPPQITGRWEPDILKRTPTMHWMTDQQSFKTVEYAGLGVVQLRFLQLHSLTSFQSVTIRCPTNHSSRAYIPDSANILVHLLGDSGTEIGSNLITISRDDCVVNLLVRVMGSADLHRGDMKLLPVQSVGVDVPGLSSLLPEITAVLGPLCFL
ncbi:collagen alpha-1(V) chain-like [Gadus chalcogrammus]|uniref:collagen alpha-1(V) chain-like n=1 Tax=Gadus chalcogrammus TaxID=1042646 RepID=UPI0024C49281|nr:collagen alpha-1(V) chain-like [Gadus chalcogrammus]